MIEISLPAQLNAGRLLPFLAALRESKGSDVRLDFSRLQRITPAGLVALAARVDRWRKQGSDVHSSLPDCPIAWYLDRMSLPQSCGWEGLNLASWPVTGRRHVPVRYINQHVDQMGQEIAACLAPGGEDFEHPMSGLFDFASYVFTETANNTRQHSAGNGFAAAQATRTDGLIRLAIADNGMGIRQTFADAGFDWATTCTDADAIRTALQPRMSCKAGEPNEGVGLTLVAALARLTSAWLLIVSGRGVLRMNQGAAPIISELPDDGTYKGTIVAMTFPERDARAFSELLHRAKQEAGLLQLPKLNIRFET